MYFIKKNKNLKNLLFVNIDIYKKINKNILIKVKPY